MVKILWTYLVYGTLASGRIKFYLQSCQMPSQFSQEQQSIDQYLLPASHSSTLPRGVAGNFFFRVEESDAKSSTSDSSKVSAALLTLVGVFSNPRPEEARASGFTLCDLLRISSISSKNSKWMRLYPVSPSPMLSIFWIYRFFRYLNRFSHCNVLYPGSFSAICCQTFLFFKDVELNKGTLCLYKEISSYVSFFFYNWLGVVDSLLSNVADEPVSSLMPGSADSGGRKGAPPLLLLLVVVVVAGTEGEASVRLRLMFVILLRSYVSVPNSEVLFSWESDWFSPSGSSGVDCTSASSAKSSSKLTVHLSPSIVQGKQYIFSKKK